MMVRGASTLRGEFRPLVQLRPPASSAAGVRGRILSSVHHHPTVADCLAGLLGAWAGATPTADLLMPQS